MSGGTLTDIRPTSRFSPGVDTSSSTAPTGRNDLRPTVRLMLTLSPRETRLLCAAAVTWSVESVRSTLASERIAIMAGMIASR